MTKKLLTILLFIALNLLLTSCTKRARVDFLSPFEQFAEWNYDETGMYIDGKQISETLAQYGLLDEIKSGLDDELKDFGTCTAEISGFNTRDKKVALLVIKQGHFQIYILFSNNGGGWNADGYTFLNERFDAGYRMEISNNGEYWLVLNHESNRGLGLTLTDEVWINPDGSVAAQYPLSGWVYFFPESTNQAWAEFSTTPYYDKDSIIVLNYRITFHFTYKDKFQSVYSPVILENWVYDLDKAELVFTGSDPELPDEISSKAGNISSDYGIIGKYIDYYKPRFNDKPVSTLEDWEMLME